MAGELTDGVEKQEERKNDDLNVTVKMKEEDYRTLLQKRYGVSLDELLSWYKEEMDRTRNEVFAIAAKLDIPEPAPKTMQEVNEMLFRYEGPCDSPQEMLERANEYLKRTRRWPMSTSDCRRMRAAAVWRCRRAAKIPIRGAAMREEIFLSGRSVARCS